MNLPERARVVVVGGGVIGTSVAYHLARQGVSDVVLLERDRLTAGTTWHAAGLMVTFGSLSETSTRMRQYTRDLYAGLESETGLSTGLRQCGFIELATDEGRLEEYRRVAAFNRHCGVDVHEISPAEVRALFPLARTDDVLAGFYVAEDGRANPVDVTMSLAKGARMRGVRVLEGVPVTGVLRRGDTVTGVRTPFGDIEAETVVNCAGMWARQLGEQAGVSIPLQAAEHYYLITEPIDGVSADLPVLEDPGAYGYFREETGGLMVGLFEGAAAPWRVDRVPDDFSFGTLPPDWDRMAPYLEAAMSRIPVTATAGVRTFFCGPESFTPDLAPIFGESPELRNYFVAAGLNSIGILTGGGIGRALAHWIAEGRPDVDVTGMHIDRLRPYQANRRYRAERTVEALGMVYQAHYPTRAMRSARDAKRSPLHDRLAVHRPYLRDVSGWEMPDVYGFTGSLSPTWGRPEYFEQWAAEHRAAREGVILMDMSFMAKFLVQGRDAADVLEELSANRVGTMGTVTYTQWLNEGGTIEADLTVTRLDEDRFWVVASDTAHRHVEARLRRHAGDRHAFVTDVTSGWAQLNVQGPGSRDLLAAVSPSDLSFPFRGAAEIEIGYARVLCLRITYVGELGYELYVPAEQAVHVYDTLVEAGAAAGLRHAGLKALASLRMEKGYRDYGHDIDNTDGVLEAGLGFAVALDKPAFVGRDAVLARKAAGPLTQRLVQVLVTDPKALLYHGEVIRRDGRDVGYVRAASYGHTLGGAVGLAMLATGGEPLDQAWLDGGELTVEVAGSVYPARASLRPLYDPTSARVRA
ncbi:FAD-dependent oxidoreductase [Dactylosporangium sucinum]|uniref:FAD-dependent oxidoreductase n=1 Tax=Dactylosporangium sucinum TaxID=1424081 RepID=A0A917TNZ8_9ACTN|nr:FAD-dependent oxidoreductase [Dactylosporangium sucinum]GGM31042.1 FAD-dependent oxidoreductase [Dactylosporangium sucinum]